MPRGTETITVVGRAPDEDWQGDPEGDPSDDRELKGCIVWSPTTRDRPDVVLDARGVFVPVGNIPPLDDDELLYEGVNWSIDGTVGPQKKKNGRLQGWLFSMKRVGGGAPDGD